MANSNDITSAEQYERVSQEMREEIRDGVRKNYSTILWKYPVARVGDVEEILTIVITDWSGSKQEKKIFHETNINGKLAQKLDLTAKKVLKKDNAYDYSFLRLVNDFNVVFPSWCATQIREH